MKKFLTGFVVVSFILPSWCASLQAGLIATIDTFDTGIGSNGSWVHVGTETSGGIFFDGTSSFDGGLTGGDLLDDDGGLRFNTFDGVVGNEGMGLAISGTMALGEQISFSYGFYNDNSSYNRSVAQLFNLTDSTVLATSPLHVIDGTAGQPTPENIDAVLAYTAIASDVGDTLQIRFLESNNNAARDIYVDNYSVTSVSAVPEPSTFVLLSMSVFGFSLLHRSRKLQHCTKSKSEES